MIDPTKTPAIVCISADNAETLASQFRRYGFDYDVHVVHSALEGKHTTKALLEDGSTVALYVMDSALPDATWYEAVSMMRTAVPTPRRVVVTPWERFVEEGTATFRHAQAAGRSTRTSCFRVGCATRSSTSPSANCSTTGVRRLRPRSSRSR